MDSTNFCYWLQGWMEIQRPSGASPEQLKEIQNHLELVFNKVTPPRMVFAPEGSYQAGGVPFKSGNEISFVLRQERPYCASFPSLEVVNIPFGSPTGAFNQYITC